MTFTIENSSKKIIIVLGLLPTVLLLKVVIQRWWDIIDIENYYDHLIVRNPSTTICFYEPPSIYWLFGEASFYTIICILTLLVLTFKPWTYIVYKSLLILTFGISMVLFFYFLIDSNILWRLFYYPLKDLFNYHIEVVLTFMATLLSGFIIRLWTRPEVKFCFQELN